MDDILVAVLSMLLVFSLVPLFLWKRRRDSKAADRLDEEPLVPQRENVVRATGARRMRRRPATRASTSTAAAAVEELGDESDDEDAEVENEARGRRKKDKKRQEREAQRQAEQASRDSRLVKQDRYAESRRRKDEEREAEERRMEEEAKARQAKEEAAAALEFEKWKGAFSIDAEGTTENEAQENQNLLSDFVEYIKKQKCVPLEDLAAEFRLRTQECINRITALENMGKLSGVMDDRGKYIYISLEEMKAVADYIKREGRVSISHLASKSNQFIDLEPKVQYEEITSVDEILAV
ncbi:DDRGK domain-containing protein 1-like isoform X1 [Chenopodium quinoa]|uniref:DDRGK domain-containing protein 1-like isoform X1 n=2 Tax=Chenopodium quinoa TaxID=63459 RepID=UPI000B78D516|nr:DDRGK domain-containing protein 1-like isoform X1 [Chenopodium quinoa]XP_021742840.1 DDRGK domain-containing protein 1-like isoform X1 [Chenopodium quinoa]XP_021742846.1 DDRGK domain-containing protein 1-like isoform X1 [Chenopodium quinoa]